MLRSVRELDRYVLAARDGEIGRCKDFLFDDRYWTIRYMVADTGKWLPGRKVLVSPALLGEPDWANHHLPVDLSKKQIQDSPPLDEHAPVSRQHEQEIAHYYAMPYYWTGGTAWGESLTAAAFRAEKQRNDEKEEQEDETSDSHLRSVKEVIGYHIAATDAEIGHVEDFVAEDETWTLRYIIVDTRNWLPGRKVLVPPDWAMSVDWEERNVKVDLTSGEVKSSPEYDPSEPINRQYEIRFYDYYGRRKYWAEKKSRQPLSRG